MNLKCVSTIILHHMHAIPIPTHVILVLIELIMVVLFFVNVFYLNIELQVFGI